MYTASRGWQVQSLPTPAGPDFNARAVGVCERFRVLQAVSDDHVLPGVRVDGRADGSCIQGTLVACVAASIAVRIGLDATIHRPYGIEHLLTVVAIVLDAIAVGVGLRGPPVIFTGSRRLQVGSFAGVPHENSG